MTREAAKINIKTWNVHERTVLQKQKSSRERRVKEEKLDDVVKQKRRVVALCRHATQKHIRERDSSATQPITMSLLSWNCHGLEHPGAVQFLCKLLKLENPEIVFSSKTKHKNKEFEGVEREDFFPQ
ncbi:hypothetical protein NC652_020909 [Populus alba x Populus x berolinensis]|nr:hypothetical protein NC652_020909 [Populus alba x Populus x berolinensis]